MLAEALGISLDELCGQRLHWRRHGLTPGFSCLVTVSISDGGACINVPIAQDLSFSDGHAGWTPLD